MRAEIKKQLFLFFLLQFLTRSEKNYMTSEDIYQVCIQTEPDTFLCLYRFKFIRKRFYLKTYLSKTNVHYRR